MNRPAACAFPVLLTAGLLAQPVSTGADRLLEPPYRTWLEGRRVGVITNQTGVNRQFVPTVEILEAEPTITVTALFAPEHGLSGHAQAGEKLESTAQVYSLYGRRRSPTPDMLSEVDLLIYDIQDVGARFYTYISTLYGSMKAAAAAGIPVIVLDRPNPIGGRRVEGPVLESGSESFVGIHRIPIRYGMTAGELARLFNQEAQLGADLRIVPLQGWKRDQWFDATGLPWIPPSPNMPTLDTATVYPGFCLLEGTNLSEGRGTTRPFEWVGAPWLEAEKLAEHLNRMPLPGVHFRPQSFTPTFSKYQGQLCRGVQVHVVDRETFRPVETAVYLLAAVRRRHPERFVIHEGFDRLAGNSWMRRELVQGTNADAITSRWREELAEFRRLRVKYLLYP